MFRHPSVASFRFLFLALLLGAVAHPVLAQDAPLTTDPGTTAAAPADPAAPQQTPPAIPPQRPSGLTAEPAFLSKIMNFADNWAGSGTGNKKEGFYPELSNMITGAGWLAAGPGYRRYFAKDQAYAEASAALSWHAYKMGQVKVEAPELANRHLTLGTQAMWSDNTQVHYFGIGPDINPDAESQYRLQAHDVVGYAIGTFAESFTVTGIFGWLGRPALMDPGGTFLDDTIPNTRQAFPAVPAATLSKQPSYLHDEVAVASDTRDHRGHPTEGHLYRGALTNYWDRTGGFFTFHTWEAEALEYIPLADKRVVLAFHGWTVSSPPEANHEIPFYLMPTIGGSANPSPSSTPKPVNGSPYGLWSWIPTSLRPTRPGDSAWPKRGPRLGYFAMQS